MQYEIPLSYNPIDVRKLSDVLLRYEGVHHNQLIHDFEKEFRKLTGAEYAVALNSGTAAIHLALNVLGIGPGDYVIAPTFTYVATISPAIHLGAQPVFVDSERETWNMDPNLLEEAIKSLILANKKPKAIIVVHTYGMPSRMKELSDISERYGVPIVEDAAESLGSTYNQEHVGLMGKCGIFSFNNNKIATTYGGGIFATNDEIFAQRVRFLAAHARENLPYYEHKEAGFNYNMGPLNAAAGLSQLPDIQGYIEKKRQIFDSYRRVLSGLNIEFQPEIQGNRSNRWFSVIFFKTKATKDEVISVLGAKNIETRPAWRPMHQQTVFKGALCFGGKVSGEFFETGLCLPSGRDLNDEKIELIARVIREVVKK
jgi:dTDP-4-amino-4,6-dideoxygalactose transaminase